MTSSGLLSAGTFPVPESLKVETADSRDVTTVLCSGKIRSTLSSSNRKKSSAVPNLQHLCVRCRAGFSVRADVNTTSSFRFALSFFSLYLFWKLLERVLSVSAVRRRKRRRRRQRRSSCLCEPHKLAHVS